MIVIVVLNSVCVCVTGEMGDRGDRGPTVRGPKGMPGPPGLPGQFRLRLISYFLLSKEMMILMHKWMWF